MSYKKIIWDRIVIGEFRSFLSWCSVPGRLFFSLSTHAVQSCWRVLEHLPFIWYCRCNLFTGSLAFSRGMGRPHSPTETVRFTLTALLVWVSTLPKDPEGKQTPPASVHQHLHSFPMCQLTAFKAPLLKAVSLLLLLQNIVYGKGTDRCQGQPVIDSQQLLLLLPCSFLLCYWQFSLSQTLVSLTATPAMYFYCENLLVICRSSMHTDTATTRIQVSSQLSDMGLFWKRSSHDICEKFKSLQRFLQWLKNFISAKPPSTAFQWHGSFREDFLFSFIFWYLPHQSDIKSLTSFLQTSWRSQEENTNIWTTCEICLGD